MMFMQKNWDTIFGFVGAASTAIKNAVTNVVATNNIVYNQSAAIADNATAAVRHDYNLFISCTSVPSESNGVTTSSNPFINSAAHNYHLSVATASGVSLAAPFNADMDGVSRGADGVWDRGAYEYVSSGGGGAVLNVGTLNKR